MSTSKPQTRPGIRTLVTLTSLAVAAGWTGAAADPSNWQYLEAISFSEVETDGEWRVVKEFPAALTDGQSFAITGYYVPIEAQPYVTQFLLVPDPADCPFCGSNGYGISLEVRMARPLPDMAEATEITVTGTLELIDDPTTYQFARLRDATLLGAGG